MDLRERNRRFVREPPRPRARRSARSDGSFIFDHHGKKYIDYRDQLLAVEREAVGGEMKGAGLYVSSHEHKVDWIVIKAICDWADGHKSKNKTARQKKAAGTAAQFVIQALQYAPLTPKTPLSRNKWSVNR